MGWSLLLIVCIGFTLARVGEIFEDCYKQVIRSGTSIGANIKEAIRGQSKADFYAKMNIALKEASETEYWLELLHESDYITEEAFTSIYADCQELLRLLMSITKSSKGERNS